MKMLTQEETKQKNKLLLLLALNASMFFIEMVAGWINNSAGLMADGLDMLADAVVYGLAVYAVGRTIISKNRAAKFAGLVELSLAALAFGRVAYQIRLNLMPEAQPMILIALLALAVNITCLLLLRSEQDKGSHMKASYIFSANDVLANLGLIIAGVLVAQLNSPIPDWIIGFLIGVLAVSGAIRILRLK